MNVATDEPVRARKVLTTKIGGKIANASKRVPATVCSSGKAMAALKDGHMIHRKTVPARESRSDV